MTVLYTSTHKMAFVLSKQPQFSGDGNNPEILYTIDISKDCIYY